jgi:hypothetical protein
LKQTGLFSAVIAALIVVSLQDLRPNSQDTSAFYLEKLYQLQADPGASLPTGPSAVASPPAFSPPKYAVWVNSLWALSLVISLSCAMLATSLQQWSRRYIRITHRARCSPHNRARIRAFFAHGIEKFHFLWAVEALPAMVHLSFFVFCAGLLIYLFNIDHTVFKVVVCWMALFSIVYAFITFLPMFRHDSPTILRFPQPFGSYMPLLCMLPSKFPKLLHDRSSPFNPMALSIVSGIVIATGPRGV